jgi:predicted aspartyl protease
LLDADGDFLCSSPVVSLFRVNVVARNTKREEVQTPAVEVLVDTRSELTWLPRDLLNQAGITPRRQRTFRTATTQTVTREVGYAILAADGYETADEVVLAEPGDMILLGVRTLEGFGVAVDHVGHRLWRRRPSSPDCPNQRDATDACGRMRHEMAVPAERLLSIAALEAAPA